jgi:hypothetical protein
VTPEEAAPDVSKKASIRTSNLLDLLPPSWKCREGQSYVSAYRMLGVPLSDLSPPFAVELANVCVLFAWMELPHLRVESEYEPSPDGQIRVNVHSSEGRVYPGAPSALFITTVESGDPRGLAAAQQDIHETVGVLSAFESMTLVFEHLENYWFSLPDGKLSAAASLLVDPLWFYAATLDEAARHRWQLASKAITSSADAERIRLSLRWFDEAKRSRGVDAFLKFWFALETLAMPDTTDISSIRAFLAAIYSVAGSQTEAHFGIGRLFGLRSHSVHNGLRIDLQPHLLSYIGGIYLDLLVHTLGFSAPKRAQAALDEAGGLAKVLPKAAGGKSPTRQTP